MITLDIPGVQPEDSIATSDFPQFHFWTLNGHVTSFLVSSALGVLVFQLQDEELGFHSTQPIYDEQTVSNNCPYLTGHLCYYDGSTLGARTMADVYYREGVNGLWIALAWFLEDLLQRSKPV